MAVPVVDVVVRPIADAIELHQHPELRHSRDDLCESQRTGRIRRISDVAGAESVSTSWKSHTSQCRDTVNQDCRTQQIRTIVETDQTSWGSARHTHRERAILIDHTDGQVAQRCDRLCNCDLPRRRRGCSVVVITRIDRSNRMPPHGQTRSREECTAVDNRRSAKKLAPLIEIDSSPCIV
ncbi:hypothetical protein D3C71_1640110 [compost metagenome]